MTSVLKTRGRGRLEAHREGRVQMATETGLMQPRAKERWQPPEADEERDGVSSEAL